MKTQIQLLEPVGQSCRIDECCSHSITTNCEVFSNMIVMLCGVNCSSFVDYAKRIRELYPKLLGKLQAKKVSACMFQRKALTANELDSIQSSRTEGESAEIVLKIVSREVFQVFSCFLDALRQTGQTDLYTALVNIGK